MSATVAEQQTGCSEGALTHLVGRFGVSDGPRLLVVGGLHGNEPAGVVAAERVIERLRELAPTMTGELVAVRGNRRAACEGQRFLSEDLNRIWTVPRAEKVRRGEIDDSIPEEVEMAELLELLDDVLGDDRPTVLLDCHTASAKSVPFVLIGDEPRNWGLAGAIPLPTVLGLEECIDGSLLEFLGHRGQMTLGVEGGQHDDPAAADHIESVIWLALVASGCCPADQLPELDERRRRLEAAAGDLPRYLEVSYRHPVAPDDEFVMRPGYVNFQRVAAGEVLARWRGGELHAPAEALILLPLYQGRGNDGFFLAREMTPFWMKVCGLARRTGLGSLLRWLPGARFQTDELGESYLIGPKLARWFPRSVLRLFGYRKVREREGQLLIGRRTQRRHRPR